jgi:hypothetical protein
MGIFIAYGFSVATVFIHATYNDRNVLLWTAVGLVPVFGIIFYFLIHYIHGLGDVARRQKIHAERHWEFLLTEKGKPKDPNEPDDEADRKPRHTPGHRAEVIDESPPSRAYEDPDS